MSSKGTVLKPGTPAPHFELKLSRDKKISLKDYIGRKVILVFYPADFSPVCSDQLALYNELLPEFRRYNAEVVAISVDSVWSHKAFAKDRKISFPLLSDFEPKGAVSKLYGVYKEQSGYSERALFIIDEEGIIQWSYVSPTNVNPGADGILKTLEELESKKK
ncbi:MAG: peroxiredoxin [Nitrososphaeria archaeon]